MEQKTRRLTDLQRRFVAAYLRCGRVGAAARQAGYRAATATHSSGRLMRAPHIKAAIADGLAQQERKGDRLHDRVVRELETVAFAPLDSSTVRTADKVRALYLLGRIARQDKTSSTEDAPVRDATTPPWQEAWRRGMERVERGRQKDAAQKHHQRSESHQEETKENTADVSPKPPPAPAADVSANQTGRRTSSTSCLATPPKPPPVPVVAHPDSPFRAPADTPPPYDDSVWNYDPYELSAWKDW